MLIFMWLLPMLSIVLLLMSITISIQNQKERSGSAPKFFLALDGVLLFSLITFLILFLQDETIVTVIPPGVYWFLLALGIIVAVYSTSKKYVPGHLTSAALLLFIGLIAILTMGIIFIFMAIIQLSIAFFQYKKTGKNV